MRELNDYINASIKPLQKSLIEVSKNRNNEDGAKTCPARSNGVNHRKSFSVACGSQQTSCVDAAYGNYEIMQPANQDERLETPQAKNVDEKELNVFKQTSTFEIETPCFKGPMRQTTNGSTMYANFPRQPSID